jgi:hypothetical protein
MINPGLEVYESNPIEEKTEYLRLNLAAKLHPINP